MTERQLSDFSLLTLKIGVNLQKGQSLEIICPIEKYQVAHAMAKTAYSLGAKIVSVRWEDDLFDKINYENASINALTEVPKWIVEQRNHLVKENFCYVAISAEDPSVFKDIPAEKLSAVVKARSQKLKKFSDCVMANGIRWCVVSVPTLAWAKQVFPTSDNPEDELWNAICKTMRLDQDNPLESWVSHVEALDNRAKFLNDNNFSYIRFKNSIGTDLKVGLCDDHVWLSAKEKAKDGINFVANMPTEEVFTAPHKNKVFGRVKSALPLCYNGQIIDNFTIDFNKGKVVGFSAEKGYDVLKGLIETDNGTFRLGEVALIGKTSPIAQTGVLFFNTLFDENASCHLALGKGYPTTVKNSENLSKKELSSLGLNDSVEHVDFMIGTPDLSVTGVKSNGEEIPLFIDGDWCI